MKAVSSFPSSISELLLPRPGANFVGMEEEDTTWEKQPWETSLTLPEKKVELYKKHNNHYYTGISSFSVS